MVRLESILRSDARAMFCVVVTVIVMATVTGIKLVVRVNLDLIRYCQYGIVVKLVVRINLDLIRYCQYGIVLKLVVRVNFDLIRFHAGGQLTGGVGIDHILHPDLHPHGCLPLHMSHHDLSQLVQIQGQGCSFGQYYNSMPRRRGYSYAIPGSGLQFRSVL